MVKGIIGLSRMCGRGVGMDFIALLGLGFRMVSGILSGIHAHRVLAETKRQTDAIIRLKESIYYAEHAEVVRDMARRKQQVVTDAGHACGLLEPVQASLGDTVLSSAIIQSPGKMIAAMKTDPWRVLDEVRPLGELESHRNPNMVPILFRDGTQVLVGWQMRGMLEQLFDCEYVSNESLWLPVTLANGGTQTGRAAIAVPTETAIVQITRDSTHGFSGWRLRVFINGSEVGMIGNGETQAYEVPPGSIRLRLARGPVKSPEVPLSLAGGETMRLACSIVDGILFKRIEVRNSGDLTNPVRHSSSGDTIPNS